MNIHGLMDEYLEMGKEEPSEDFLILFFYFTQALAQERKTSLSFPSPSIFKTHLHLYLSRTREEMKEVPLEGSHILSSVSHNI